MVKIIRKLIIEPGPIVSLTLIGLLLLGVLLYYRAITIQRFLEPALAISQPKIEFAENLNKILKREFKGFETDSVLFAPDAIYVRGPFLLVGVHHMEKDEGPQVFSMLANAFGSILENPDMRRYVDMILVSTKIPPALDPEQNRRWRTESRMRAEFILNALFEANPTLQDRYQRYFSAAPVMAATEEEAEWVEFKIIPTQRLHIEVLQRFQKYVR